MPPKGRQNNSVYCVHRARTFEASRPASCRIETESGTVYWVSAPDEEGVRTIVRERSNEIGSSTMLVPSLGQESKSTQLGRRFRGRLTKDVEIGDSLVIEVKDAAIRILTEVAVKLEEGEVPDAVFE